MSESDIVIRAEGLGKRYQLGQGVDLTRTFREAVMDFPRKLKRLARGRPAARPVATSLPSSEPTDPDTPPGTFWALRDVNFQIKRGEVVGIIGRNGAGKSTLLKVLSRITWPTTGRAELRGRLASLLEVGTGFHPELTGRENIFLNGAILGMRKQEIAAKFDEIVAFAEIERFLDTPVKRYSSGMYVRLAFAVAAHLEPEILIVDEVLAVGDAAFQKKCLGRMNDVAKGGRTVLFVSHNMAAVRSLCSRALLLEQGRPLQFDMVEPVLNRYLAMTSTDEQAIVRFDRPTGAAPGWPLRLMMTNAQGQPRSTFRMLEPWRMILEFEMGVAQPEVVAAIGVTTMDRTPLITYWSTPRDLAPGRYRIEAECRLPLRSNHLQFAVGLTSRDVAIYYRQDLGGVFVSEVTAGEQLIRTSGDGGILMNQQPIEIELLEN